MKLLKSLAAAALVTGLLTSAALAETVVKVTLIDKMTDSDLSKPLGLGVGMKADMSKAPMGVAVNPKLATPGAVRLDVTNLASSLVHEVQVARITDESQVLTYDQSRNKVDTEGLEILGSVAEIMPSKSASLIIDLSPGKYLLFCNVAGHYMAGMWAIIEVK
ncbi:sulfocyanin-like copper-binding protein [Aestuariivirga litoralis]|uniref:sulfocyanin-like copper-binding protein n=1 Tax=Aestuariivirga litoralis TaxID=2650924 RepID=UPI0018C80937|nr:sulfocyanin-like copper-binding protein [Aestuariivirga litoralis]MBG1231390.1 hypothetical protein [Aestuariivirga litoralis]